MPIYGVTVTGVTDSVLRVESNLNPNKEGVWVD